MTQVGHFAVKRLRLPVWPFAWRLVLHDATTGVWLAGYSGLAKSRADADAKITRSLERSVRNKGGMGEPG